MQAEEQQQQLCHSLDIASHIDVLQKKKCYLPLLQCDIAVKELQNPQL